VLLFAGGAFADIIVNGDLSDWGVTPGVNWQNSVGAQQWSAPNVVGPNGYVGPGYGGQTFNVQETYVKTDANSLYYAIVTGFPDAGTTYNGTTYYPGDIFFDLSPYYTPSASTTPTGRMDFAVETTTYDSQHPLGGMSSQNQGAGSFYSNVGIDLVSNQWNGVYYPKGIDRTGLNELADGTLVGQTSFAYNDTYYGTNYYVMEGQIPLAFFGNAAGSPFYMDWTMSCGNDIGQLGCSMPLGKVPEPGTLLLFGSGALGVFGWIRRQRIK
jgi:hypothetical protein